MPVRVWRVEEGVGSGGGGGEWRRRWEVEEVGSGGGGGDVPRSVPI